MAELRARVAGRVARTLGIGAIALAAVAAIAGCGDGDDGAGGVSRSTAEAAVERHDFAEVERCVRERAPGAMEEAEGGPVTGLADDAFTVLELPSSQRQSATVAGGEDAHALVAAYRQLATVGFVDQHGADVVVAWQSFPDAADRAVIEPCL